MTIFLFTGCVDGVVSEDNYCEIFEGVDAEDADGNSIYYQMRTLVDNTEFNTTIRSKPYCKLDIYLKKKDIKRLYRQMFHKMAYLNLYQYLKMMRIIHSIVYCLCKIGKL